MSLPEALEHLRAGRPQAAAVLLATRIGNHPTDADAWFLLGAARHALNELSAAADAFSHSLRLNPANAEAHFAHVSVLRAMGHKHAALEASRKAIGRFPNDVRVLYAMALCFEDLGDDQDALAHYDAALATAPTFADALHNRTLLLVRLGRLEDAEGNLRAYVAAHPDDGRAQLGLADVWMALGRFEDALTAIDAAERLAPGEVGGLLRRGVALASLRRFAEARTCFLKARDISESAVVEFVQRIAPGSGPDLMLSPENIYFSRGWGSLGHCDWSGWDSYVAEMRRAVTDPEIAIEPAVAFMCRLVPLTGAERHGVSRHVAVTVEAKNAALPPLPASRQGRVRIGVLSPDFREHLNAYLLLPLFELLDRSRFQLHAYSLSSDDGSAIRRRVRSAVDRFLDLEGLSDREAALAIRSDDLDMLLDVGGHTTGARFAITAQRPARLHVNYLGFSCSLASPRVDYAIVDRIVGSDDAEWTEARIFLPHTHFLYDFRKQPAHPTITRQDYGLPDDAFVYCAFHRAEKISPDVFDLWMRILSRVSQSVLWFRALSQQSARNLRARAPDHGVDPARLVFAPFEASQDPRYLARHTLGDLMLDSLHHNAMTSACDALGMGLPLLTLRGNAMAARAGESLVRAAGLPDLVARDKDEYVRIAVQLAREPAALRELKERLRANRRTAPLFDTAGRVRALESAFQGMYDRMMRGEPPASFEV